MVVKIMKWRPWPPAITRKFKVKIVIHRLESFTLAGEGRVMVDLKWKGPRNALGRLGRTLKRDRTSENGPDEEENFCWNEEFEHECVLSVGKKPAFQPWNVHLLIMQASQQETKKKRLIGGTAIINLSDFASMENANEMIRILVSRSDVGDVEATLVVTINCVELRHAYETLDPVLRNSSPSLPHKGTFSLQENDNLSEGEEKNLKGNAVRRSRKKLSGESLSDGGKLSPRSIVSSHPSGELFDSDSPEDCDLEDIEDEKKSYLRNSFSYGTLAGVNLFVEGALPLYRDDTEDDDNMICRRAVAEGIPKMEDGVSILDSDQTVLQPTMQSLLSWRKRKLSFRSPKARGEPLLNKAYGEDGGDDIDFDRRQLGSPTDSISFLRRKMDDCCSSPAVSAYLDFGDDHFSIGSWEKKSLLSRDGHLKLTTNAFFASIDQRSERAAGESACTTLVAVIADWLHRNPNRMPIKAEFDTLIREGSAEWRKLCLIEAYKERFPDRHFDLETVLQAETRPLSVISERSFVGFFQPEGLDSTCDFLQGAMSFENMWEAISEEIMSMKPEESAIYIVSWNDHFFVLKAGRDSYYIIDTLGERLFEGCNQAYILRFDEDTSLCHLPVSETADGEKKMSADQVEKDTSPESLPLYTVSLADAASEIKLSNQVDGALCVAQQENERKNRENDAIGLSKLETPKENIVYKGKEACKHFLKGFFAAVPLRELQVDIKKGLMGKVPLHRRLQIEFHYTLLTSSKVPATAHDI